MDYPEKYKLIISTIRSLSKKILPKGSRVVLYGSHARGDFNEDSDWDFHILIPGEEKLSLEEESKYAYPLQEIGWSMGECFSVMVYSHSGWLKRNFLPYYKNVEKEKVVLYNSIPA